MKCKYCGGTVTFEDERCPHCNRINEHAVRHIKDMAHYSKDYEDTSKKVHHTLEQSAQFRVRGILLVILVVFFIGASFLLGDIQWENSDNRQEYAIAHDQEIKKQMMVYWEAEQYDQFLAFCDYYQITGMSREPFVQEYAMMESAQTYHFIQNHIAHYLSTDYIYEKDDDLDTICSLLHSFYAKYKPDYYTKGYADEEINKERLAGIYHNMDRIMMTYFYVEESDLTQIHESDGPDIAVIFRKRIKEHE